MIDFKLIAISLISFMISYILYLYIFEEQFNMKELIDVMALMIFFIAIAEIIVYIPYKIIIIFGGNTK